MTNSIKVTVLVASCAWLSLATARASSTVTRSSRAPIDSACTGLSDAERLAALETIKSNISGADQILVSPGAKAPKMRPSGATLYVRATPGVTAEWLERVVVCDAQQQGTVVRSGERVSVSAERGGFAIQVSSDNLETAQQIWTRAEALVH